MRQALGVLLLLGCAAQPKTGRPYKDAPVLVGVAVGTAGAAQVAAAAVVTVAVGTVVVGANQFPDPPAGTPPTEIDTAPRNPPDLCRGCRCWGRGKGPGLPGLRQVPDGSGVAEHTRATCQEACSKEFNGFDCSGDKGKITWFRQ